MTIKRVFDEADFQRRLADNEAMSTGQELKLVITGGLNAAKQMQAARKIALKQARKEIRQAIRDEEQRVRAANLLIWTSMEVEYFGHQKEEIELVGL